MGKHDAEIQKTEYDPCIGRADGGRTQGIDQVKNAAPGKRKKFTESVYKPQDQGNNKTHNVLRGLINAQL